MNSYKHGISFGWTHRALPAASILLGLLTLTARPSWSASFAFNIGSNGTLGTLDLASGALTQTGNSGISPAGMGEIGSTLFTAADEGTGLYRVNTLTGDLTQISSLGLNGAGFNTLGSTTSGLYALDNSFNLYRINPTTGVATLLGPTGAPTGIVSGSYGFSLSTGSSALYFEDDFDLYSINTTTGKGTLIGQSGAPGIGFNSLVSENGTLYGVESSNTLPYNTLYTINTSTGVGTLDTALNPDIAVASFGLAPVFAVPEPDSVTLSLLGLGFIAIGSSRRLAAHLVWRSGVRRQGVKSASVSTLLARRPVTNQGKNSLLTLCALVMLSLPCAGQGPVLIFAASGALGSGEGYRALAHTESCSALVPNPTPPSLFPGTFPAVCSIGNTFNQSPIAVQSTNPAYNFGTASGSGSAFSLMASATPSGTGNLSVTSSVYQDGIVSPVPPGQTLNLTFSGTISGAGAVQVSAKSDNEGFDPVNRNIIASGPVTISLVIGDSGKYSIGVTALAETNNGASLQSTASVTWSTFVAVGDSYASGAGDKPYGTSAADGSTGCRRAANNFPSRMMNMLPNSSLSSLNLDFEACSGANVYNLTSTELPDEPVGTSQLSFLNGGTELVTVMVGVNDTATLGLGTTCVLGPLIPYLKASNLLPNVNFLQYYAQGTPCMNQLTAPGGPTYSGYLDLQFSNLLGQLVSLYGKIRDRAPRARILAPSYPSLFPPNPPASCSLQYTGISLPISQQDAKFMWQAESNLNIVIARAAKYSGIEYVDLNGSSSGFPLHSLCSTSPWFLTPYAAAQMSNNDPSPITASLHPNGDGEAEMAQLILAKLGMGQPNTNQFQLTPLQTVSTSLVVPAGQGTAVFSSSWASGDIVMTLTSPSGKTFDRTTTNPLVNHSLGTTYEVYDILVPEAGSWTVSLSATDGVSDEEQVSLTFMTIPPAPGDADGDGIATCADMSIVKAAFGTRKGQPAYDPRADLNGDGVVNILDLSLVAQNLLPGVTCQ